MREDRLVGVRVLDGNEDVAYTSRSLEAAGNRLPEQPGVEPGDEDRHRPRERAHPEGRTNLPIFAPLAGEHHEREHRERQLQAEDHLAEDQQLAGAALAVDHDDDDRRE